MHRMGSLPPAESDEFMEAEMRDRSDLWFWFWQLVILVAAILIGLAIASVFWTSNWPK